MSQSNGKKLKKELGLFDVYAISTGAMFSSGFFLLPGLAAAKTGPSVFLAYLVAGFLIVPAMLSKAELSTALPKAGGTYFFLDRALGPMFGTIGGLGTYLALALKTAFALIGIGAYLAIFVELPIKPVACALTVAFVAINIMGAKETAGLQRVLVTTLMVILAYFIGQGLFEVGVQQDKNVTEAHFDNFFSHGIEGFVTTIGFVFVSYAGLTKVASVAEEVKNPDRNIPLGMILSLVSTTLVYVLGIFVIVALMDPVDLYTGKEPDYTPVASTVEHFTPWVSVKILVGLVSISALAAFASTGNAGVMAASRYPLAMARDRLLPDKFANLGKFDTPTSAILFTGILMIFFIVLLDAEGIAKLASAFQLFIFILENMAVIVMRESKIKSYDPGYKSPLYPWMQIAGMVLCLILIISMGWLAVLFTIGVVLICLIWFFKYGKDRVVRRGAIGHWFERLGENRYDGLEREFRGILREKGLRHEDPFNEVVGRAHFIEISENDNFENLIDLASGALAGRLAVDKSVLRDKFIESTLNGATPVAQGAALPHMHLIGIDQPEMVICRAKDGIQINIIDVMGEEQSQEVNAVFMLVSPEENPGQHLRMLAELANKIDQDDFIESWRMAPNPAHIKQLLFNDGHYIRVNVKKEEGTNIFIDKQIKDLRLPEGCLIAMIQRDFNVVIPKGNTVLQEGDRFMVIGEPLALAAFKKMIGE
ncbi:MAG: amino acid permease [Lentisphaeria bacterium]|nr:amino acid permease [Lentisphaeria bacterium]